jgi:hypothetical protein
MQLILERLGSIENRVLELKKDTEENRKDMEENREDTAKRIRPQGNVHPWQQPST